MQKPKPLEIHIDAREEEEVVNVAQLILEYRNTSSELLKATLASLLESQRPIHLLVRSLQSDVDLNPRFTGRLRGSESGASLTEEDKEDGKKLELIKQKISSNASAITATLKRMKGCMDHMDKLQSQKGVIHPVFKKRRPTE
ncbi:hypothetical protein Leryth_026505 [Lithospermum erythrorhizon]|nr:hypothetical protein Leryth_026505 [Lithospermum erythrorhizon]